MPGGKWEVRDRVIIGTSEAMRKVVETTKIAANSEATILITGESGTGKELFAKAVHNNSLRKDNKLVNFLCWKYFWCCAHSRLISSISKSIIIIGMYLRDISTV